MILRESLRYLQFLARKGGTNKLSGTVLEVSSLAMFEAEGGEKGHWTLYLFGHLTPFSVWLRYTLCVRNAIGSMPIFKSNIQLN